MPTPPRQLRHSGVVLAVLAPLVALWLGLAAPDTSPVQPPPAVQQAVDPAAGPDQPVTPPALHRLERAGLVGSSAEVAQGRRRRTYALTARGRKEFLTQQQDLQGFVATMKAVLA